MYSLFVPFADTEKSHSLKFSYPLFTFPKHLPNEVP
jgi:hypothetical protein